MMRDCNGKRLEVGMVVATLGPPSKIAYAGQYTITGVEEGGRLKLDGVKPNIFNIYRLPQNVRRLRVEELI